MIGAAMGLAARGAIPFPSTFAAFLTRAADFIRMAAISHLNIKMAGSHAGVSIGEDGPSQMALEDLAMMRRSRTSPCSIRRDAVSTERLVAAAAYHPGPVYMRTSRPEDAGHLRQRRDVPDRRLQGAAAEPRRRGDGDRRRRHAVRGAEGARRAEEAGHRRSASSISIGAADRRGDAARRPARETGPADHRRGSLRGGGIGDAVARRWRRPASPSRGSPCARFRAAASPKSCSTVTASRPATSSTPCHDASRDVEPIAASAMHTRHRSATSCRRHCRVRARRLPSRAQTTISGVQEPAWSPDGKRIAVSYLDRIWTMTPDGKQAEGG